MTPAEQEGRSLKYVGHPVVVIPVADGTFMLFSAHPAERPEIGNFTLAALGEWFEGELRHSRARHENAAQRARERPALDFDPLANLTF